MSVAATAALFAAADVLTLRGSYVGATDDLFTLALTLALLAFPVVGAILLRRYPENPIGWLFAAVGPLFGVMLLSQMYVENNVIVGGADGRFANLAIWLGAWMGPVAYSLIAVFLSLLFPTGRLVSRRWRPVAFLAIGSVALLTVGTMLARELDDYPQLENPYAVGPPFEDFLNGMRGVAWIVLSLSALLAGISLIIRFRRSKGVERQQIKWVALAVSLLVLSQFSWTVSEGLAAILTGISFLAIPIAVCVAILRYRLYDIDVIINRALVYGVLTAILGLLYFGMVVLLQEVTRTIMPDTDLAVACSTLAVAALFQPVRSRVQSLIDRRFYRRKYDAATALRAFSARLRDQTDLDSLSLELLGVVRETMQPIQASVWLRPTSSGEAQRSRPVLVQPETIQAQKAAEHDPGASENDQASLIR
jgi:hypothetical protein